MKLNERKFPNARRRRQPTGIYNCHGLTFANRRAWILPNQIDGIRRDDGLREVPITDVVLGDLAVYYDEEGEITHTGIVIRVDEGVKPLKHLRVVAILSKWAESAEYFHRVHECPYSDNSEVRYWTDRDD